jgi:hypothetical protein
MKNVDWSPSDTMLARELKLRGSGIDVCRAAKSQALICNSLNQKQPVRKPVQVVLDYVSEDSDSDSSDDEMNDLQQLEGFIKTSKAIHVLWELLRDFIYPPDANDSKSIPEPEERTNSENMRVYIEMLDKNTRASENPFQLHIQSSDTVEILKSQILGKRGIPPACQLLIFHGKRLGDSKTMKDYNIQKENIIYLSKIKTETAEDGYRIKGKTVTSPFQASCEWIRQVLVAPVHFTLLATGLQLPPVAAGKTRMEWRCVSFGLGTYKLLYQG